MGQQSNSKKSLFGAIHLFFVLWLFLSLSATSRHTFNCLDLHSIANDRVTFLFSQTRLFRKNHIPHNIVEILIKHSRGSDSSLSCNQLGARSTSQIL